MLRNTHSIAAAAVVALASITSIARAEPVALANPSFETASSTDASKPAGWTADAAAPKKLAWSRVTANAVEGKHCLAIHSSWSDLDKSAEPTRHLVQSPSQGGITAGQTYRAKLSYYQAPGTGPSSQVQYGNIGHVQVYVRWYDAEGKAISDTKLVDTETEVTPGKINANGDFHRNVESADAAYPQGYIHMDMKAPEKAVSAGFVVAVGTWIPSGRPYYLDDLSLSPTAAVE